MTDKNEVSYEDVIEGLSKAIYHLTWLGEFWGPDGVVKLDETRARYLKKIGEERRALANLQSTYYAAAGNAYAQSKKDFPLKIMWITSASRYLKRSEKKSNELVKISGGIKNMTPDELDVRSHILRKLKKYDGALDCIEEALSRNDVSDNSKVLLLMGKGEVFASQSLMKDAEDIYGLAESISFNSVDVPVSTRVRILKSAAQFLINKDRDNRKDILLRAKQLAQDAGLKDQVAKIEAIGKSLS